VAQLKKFLSAPENSAKAREWARILNITTAEIPSYIDRLTPVVLRHDTLVTNHEYKNGKAVPFGSLLQTGIAILVDQQGLPAVKCSCGNPLRPYKKSVGKTKVQFKGGNKQWPGYQQNHIVVVEPPPGNHDINQLQLVDVNDPDHGISRELGIGGGDTSFDTQAEHTVPTVTSMTFAQATQNLANAGLAMEYGGDSLPPDDAQVTASQPVEGSTLEWGAPVTLFVQSDDTDGQSSPPDSGGVTTGPDGSSTGPDESSTGPDGSSTGTDGSSTGTDTTPPPQSGGSSGSSSSPPGGASPSGGDTGSPGASTPPGSGGGTDSPPASSSSPPDIPTSEAATPSESVTSDPASTQPTAGSAPASSDPASSDPGAGDSVSGDPAATDATDSGGLTGVMS
jgi:hypothetical protein